MNLPVEAIVVGVGVTAALAVLVVVLQHKKRPANDVPRDPPQPERPKPPAVGDLDPFTHGSTAEKRRSVRRRGRSVQVLISDGRVTSPPREGWVVNSSLGGLRIAVRHAIPVGAVLSVCTAEAVHKT